MNHKEEIVPIRLRLNNNGSKRLEYLMFTTSDKITKVQKKRVLTWVDESSERRYTNNIYLDDFSSFIINILKEDDNLRHKVLTRLLLDGASNIVKALEEGIKNE
jgi:hypothetical protein